MHPHTPTPLTMMAGGLGVVVVPVELLSSRAGQHARWRPISGRLVHHGEVNRLERHTRAHGPTRARTARLRTHTRARGQWLTDARRTRRQGPARLTRRQGPARLTRR